MAADGGQLLRLACLNCKQRKKKCDKELPSCGHCVSKSLRCSYQNQTRPKNAAHTAHNAHTTTESSPKRLQRASPAAHEVPIPSVAFVIPADVASANGNLYRHVNSIVRSTGQFVDDITVRYFEGIHRFLPVVSRARFNQHLGTPDAVPPAYFSILLLAICLITYDPILSSSSGAVDRHSILVSARSIFAQLQAVSPPSLHLIQAGLLLALYEYAHGQPERAFASIASCARMAYSAGFHQCRQQSVDELADDVKEAANTWWGLVICERAMIGELAVFDQPLVTIFPDETSQLPTEPEIVDEGDASVESIAPVPLSSSFTVDVGGFGRTAQAARLLDQVLDAMKMSDLKGQLARLDFLSSTIRSFLNAVLQPWHDKPRAYCGAIALAIRTLFILHYHILGLAPADTTNTKYKTPEEWFESSHAELDFATKMTMAIVNSHQGISAHLSDTLPPNYMYMIQAALRHLQYSSAEDSTGWRLDAELRLRNSLAPLNRRWAVGA